MIRYTSSIGRSVLLGCVLSLAVITVVALLYAGRGGAIGAENMGAVGQQLADMYLPLLGIMAGFYFSEKAAASGDYAVGGLLFALFVLGIWLVIPLLLLLIPQFTVEDIIGYLRGAGPYGEALVAGTLTFYFSRDASEHRAAERRSTAALPG
jgi:hypothetical protein